MMNATEVRASRNAAIIEELTQWFGERVKSMSVGPYAKSDTLQIGPFNVRIIYDTNIDNQLT